MTTIGVISDTHVYHNGRYRIPERVFDLFAGVDLILHGGDLNVLSVIDELERLAPVRAVYGNNDVAATKAALPQVQQFSVEECTIGLTHGDIGHPTHSKLRSKTPDKALSHFIEEPVDCVVFGHSHRSLIDWRETARGRVLLFNPGSPTDRRYGPHLSCGVLRIDGQHITPELFTW